MAHKKGGGSTRQTKRPTGKRLGMKVGGGQKVLAGRILLRQRGTKIHPGLGVGMGRDHTLFARKPGQISFVNRRGKKIAEIN